MRSLIRRRTPGALERARLLSARLFLEGVVGWLVVAVAALTEGGSSYGMLHRAADLR